MSAASSPAPARPAPRRSAPSQSAHRVPAALLHAQHATARCSAAARPACVQQQVRSSLAPCTSRPSFSWPGRPRVSTDTSQPGHIPSPCRRLDMPAARRRRIPVAVPAAPYSPKSVPSLIRSDGAESPLLDDKESPADKTTKVKYGELVILGYNGLLHPGDRGRKRSKYVLYKRQEPNGVKRSKHYVVKTPHNSQAILDSQQHSISYTLSRNQAIIVEYMPDEETDMFQIGRSSESPIDFVVVDTVAGEKTGDGGKVVQSTISRFACRILAERANPSVARIYAAGFDSSRNIFLGEKATKWQEGRDIDGLTTNGILLMHPQGSFCGGDSEPGVWREVSVCGGIYSLRESRSAQKKGRAVEEVTNVLQDGTLIDLCGATLLWRSAEGLEKSPTKDYLENLVDKLNAGRPVCPVGLNTLVIPRKASYTGPDSSTDKQQPYVYLKCGHVQGSHDWGHEKNSHSRTCPLCQEVGPVQKLWMGIEPAFYVDAGPPIFFAFNPCGHMATEKTVKYWASVMIPHGTNAFESLCPFCATPLEGFPGYIRLIFQDNVD